MQDIYPKPSWNFVFGLANLSRRTGVFSFVRYDPAFQGIDTPDRDKILLRNSCGVMVHEIGHMFGIKHCIYYNCTMNGSNSYEESLRTKRYLCPICLKKLKKGIPGFDIASWVSKMMEACIGLGFEEDAAFYNSLLQIRK
jgi:archaemetzincin